MIIDILGWAAIIYLTIGFILSLFMVKWFEEDLLVCVTITCLISMVWLPILIIFRNVDLDGFHIWRR